MKGKDIREDNLYMRMISLRMISVDQSLDFQPFKTEQEPCHATLDPDLQNREIINEGVLKSLVYGDLLYSNRKLLLSLFLFYSFTVVFSNWQYTSNIWKANNFSTLVHFLDLLPNSFLRK